MTQTVDGTATVIRTEGAVVTNIPVIALGADGIFILSKPLDFETGRGESAFNKHISMLRVDMSTDSDGTIPLQLTVKLGWQLELEDEITWAAEQMFTSLNQIFYWNMTGRYISIQIKDYIPTIQWKITKFELLGKILGKLN